MSNSRWIFAAVIAALSPAWAGAEKPAGGICECGTYPEAPTLCAPLSGTQRSQCIVSNAHWTDQCVAWRSGICRAADTSKMSEAPFQAPPAAQTPAAQPIAPSSPAARQPITMLPEVEKFGGSWTGQAQCRAASDKWRLTMLVVQTADGKLLVTATTSQAVDSFSRSEFKDNDVTLQFDTWLSKKIYTGRLVAPDRIAGKVHITGSDCKWYLTR